MELHGSSESPKFSSVEEELSFLRGQVAEKERQLQEKSIAYSRERVVSSELQRYKKEGVQPLHPEYALSYDESKKVAESIAPSAEGKLVLDLDPETHDRVMGGLIELIKTKGIANAMTVVQKMNDPHLDDDFHRFLVSYISHGLPSSGSSPESKMWKILSHTLYEIAVPEQRSQDKDKPLRELIAVMEQFYAGMLAVSSGDKDNTFAFEIANPQGTAEFLFYASIPNGKRDLFEKHLLSVLPHAQLHVEKNDYNIFMEGGASVGSSAAYKENPIFPIKTYDEFEYDPANIILNAFSKLQDIGEGAAIQFVFSPAGDEYIKAYSKALGDIKKGVPKKKALDIQFSTFGQFKKDFGEIFKDVVAPEKGKKEEEKKEADEQVVRNIEKKISSAILHTNIRIVASAGSAARAEAIVGEIESSFNQFAASTSNAIAFKRQQKQGLRDLFHDFSFRIFDQAAMLPMNVKEVATIMHLPTSAQAVAPTLKTAKANSAPAPLGLAQDGILLGKNVYRGQEAMIKFAAEDRLRHMYVIGQTGTGKTTLLKNMIIQDIKNGEGVCLIDPHGSDVQDILANIPPERYDDLIYFDPAYTERPMALNMMEYDPAYPEQKTFVVNELFSIFKKLYGAVPESMGPAFEQYFRNSALLVMDHPESGNTLVDVARVLSDKNYRAFKLSMCKNPLVVQFWQNAEKTSGEQGLANYVQYVTNKFDVFLSNDIMRPVVSQEKSSFTMRDIMDNKKILLVNLSKGRLGDINANLIGLILVGKILMAALSRVDSFGKDLPPFYLYIDEFQNITTDSISTILSEARKYKLSLTVAHQFIKQLDESIKNAVFGNVGSMAVYRVGAEDADVLQKQLEPVFSAGDIMNLDNHHAYIKMLGNGVPLKPFSIEKISFPPAGNKEVVEQLKELSYLKFGKERTAVEQEIINKYRPI